MTFKEFFAKCKKYAVKPIDWMLRIRFYGKMKKIDKFDDNLKVILTKIEEKNNIAKNAGSKEIQKILKETVSWCENLVNHIHMKYSKIFYRFFIELFTLLILATKFILPLLPLIGSILFTTVIVVCLAFAAYKYHVISKNLQDNYTKELFAELENFDFSLLDQITENNLLYVNKVDIVENNDRINLNTLEKHYQTYESHGYKNILQAKENRIFLLSNSGLIDEQQLQNNSYEKHKDTTSLNVSKFKKIVLSKSKL